ncbi:MAG: cellulase family glycosylhydrolase [Kiritimatiellae bacterium]|nr:cellulase family glycosylhydrolase [Kiritimatiellia bacterium]
MRYGCLCIARTVALAAVLLGCALPSMATDGLWGVNYYAPFALDYNELTRRGVDPRTAIRDDVAHFHRLGLDLLRVHCFDRQISRRDGSLADTVHLELLDYLVSVAASNGMRTVITPIAWYGWSPMDDTAKAGFSNLATMREFTSRQDLWPLQARFLSEFAAHTNRYTGLSYGKDPAIVAFECINEPLYPDGWPQTNVTDYIDTLVDALRAGGATQPIFYNSFGGYNEAAGASKADGVSCSAYPLGLLAGRTLQGRQLAKIRESTLKPDAHIAGKRRMAYEFDAADTLDSCLYPAIAKMLRGEGVELAAQFQYDPLAIADENRNWHTHYLNLVYTPKKALSFLIAGRAFKSIPRGEKYAPEERRLAFPPFLTDADYDLSEMATETEYFYSNNPVTPPPKPAALERVYGCGRSSVAASDGSGAYFLDRVRPGV